MSGGIYSEGVYFRGGNFRFGMFIPDVVIEAVGQDALGITGFPVESGVTLTDHSFKLPVRLEMAPGWSDSTAGQEGYIQQIYEQLLALQASRNPFDIYTSRRMYPNMLMESLTDPITDRTFYAMIPRITFRELIISRTQETAGGGSSDNTATVGDGAPASMQAPVDQGTVQPQPVNFSGSNGTTYGGYDQSLAIGATTGAGSVGELTVAGVGSFDNSLGERAVTTDPGQLGGDPGLFGRYSPGAFSNIQPFRI